jgi:hypothetical protein
MACCHCSACSGANASSTVAGSLMCSLKAHATLPEALHHSPPGTPLLHSGATPHTC